MCDVCVATELDNGKTMSLKSEFNGHAYEMQGKSEKDPELEGPCEYRLRKNEGEWSPWIKGESLPNFVSDFGFDIHDNCRHEKMDEALESALCVD